MRPHSLGRKQNTRSPKRKFIVYTEGKNTEPVYIKALLSLWDGALVEVEIERAAGVPATIAAAAIKRLSSSKSVKKRKSTQSFEEDDQVWAMFDKDEHPAFQQSIDQCRAAGVRVAFSNPCFEMWLILHKDEFDRPDDRHQVQRHLESICTEYDRNARKTADCRPLVLNVEDAERRAIRQAQRRLEEGNAMGAPSTSMQDFTIALRTAHNQHVR